MFLFFSWALPVFAALDDIAQKPPMTTADSWVLADGESGRIIVSQNAKKRSQIASLTKVMTAVVVLEYLASKAEAEDSQSILVVSKSASIVVGTSALLEVGDRVSIANLLFGLLLPSGNDAAVALAEYVGRQLGSNDGRTPVQRFVARMNRTAETLGLYDTIFDDVHGMGENYSTPSDLATLSRHAMLNPTFRRVVNTKVKRVTISSNRGGERVVNWRNTNELLGDFDGVKTGHTNKAGGCLILRGVYRGKPLYLVLLGSSNKNTRFIDGYNLFQWGIQQISAGLLKEQ